VTQPDPDGAGPLTRPVTTFGYDLNSNVTSITDPRNNVTTRSSTNLDRTTSVTQPDPDGAGPLGAPGDEPLLMMPRRSS
jgi:YD repeat-containing protein